MFWKENILKDLEAGLLEYGTAGEFLTEIKKDFKGGDKVFINLFPMIYGISQNNKYW